MDFDQVETKCVIVTYGNRWKLLSKTLESIMTHKEINEIIIVQNGVTYNLATKLKNYSRVKLIINEENLGSAGGFSAGMNELYKRVDSDFNIILMDDDNELSSSVFDKLRVAEELHDYSDKHIWSLFRPNVQSDEQFKNDYEVTKESFYNTINGFTVEHILGRNRQKVEREYKDVVKIITAPYSGLIFQAELLKKIGLPNKDFYLYSDDIDFTWRISQNGYKIFQYQDAQAYDQGIAWQVLTESNKKNRGAFFSTEEIYRPLYTYRNEVYIAYNELKKNSLMFWLNYYALQLWMLVSYMPKNKEGYQKFKLLRKSMKYGVRGLLGKADWIEDTKGKG